MGKGSKRRNENFKKVQDNWEDISWDEKGEYCCACGLKFNKDNLMNNPDNYIFYPDGEIECKNCNFN